MKKHLFKTTGLIGLIALTLGGCVSPYHRPTVAVPETYIHAPKIETGTAMADPWWRGFNDPRLSAVIEKALAKNNSLAIATLTVRRARLVAGLTVLDQWPQASGDIEASRADSATTYSGRLSLGFDTDLWRRLASTSSAAKWEAKATDEDRQATALALIGTTCLLYWDLAFTHQQITTGEATLAYQRRLFELIRTQHDLGAVSGVEVAESQQAIAVQTAALSVLEQHLVEDRAALQLILGNEAIAFADEPQSLPDMSVAEIPAGLPADLLSRRPDLKAAEMRLRATLASGDATRAALYPNLSLTSSSSNASSALSSLFDHPVQTLTAAISLPFLDYPRHRLANKVAQADYDIAALAFKHTLLVALSDVDNALSERTQLQLQGRALQQSLMAAKTAEALYGIRYSSGAVALRIWLDAQQSLRSAQAAYDNNRLSQLNNQATLYQALGGGTGYPPIE